MSTGSFMSIRVGVEFLALKVSRVHEKVRLSVGIILMTTYWEIGRGIVEYEQCGRRRAEYDRHLLERLSRDLTQRLTEALVARVSI